MAFNQKVVLLACLLSLVVLLGEVLVKPVLAKKISIKTKVKNLEDAVKILKQKMEKLEECNACSKIKELNETLNELEKKISEPAEFECPTCVGTGPNAQKDCESKSENEVCEFKDLSQCIVYKEYMFFIRFCGSDSIYQQELKNCKPQFGCQMGRCFTSGCLATLG